MKKRISICTSLIIAALLTALLMSGVLTFSFGDDEFVYISDLKATKTEVGWSVLHNDEGLDGNPLNIWDGSTYKVYKKGICAHAPSRVSYDISGDTFRVFSAYIGVHNGTDNGFPDSSSVGFEIEVDGVSVYKSGTFKMKTPAEFIEVEIPQGASTITLITNDAGDGNTGDHSAWAEAKLIRGEIDPERMVSLTVTPEGSQYGTVGSSIPLKVEAKKYNGTFFTPSKVEYTVDDPTVAEVSNKGVVTFKGLGSVTITVKATEGDASLSKTVSLSAYDKSLEKNWAISSPDGKITVNVAEDMFGALSYSVTKDGKFVVEEGSDLGLATEESSFFDGFKFVNESRKLIDEKYNTYSGKESEGHNYANELTITFSRGNYSFDLIIRAYDEGFAYRYVIEPKNPVEKLTVKDEKSSFVIPAGAEMFSIVVPNLTSVFNHENSYSKFKSDAIGSKYLAFPILYKTTDNNWVLLTEAELYGDAYVGSMTQGVGDRELKLHPAPKVLTETVDIPCPFTSPWRMGIVGDLETIVESNLVEDVSEKTTDDFSWVEPGVTAWMWLSEGFNGQRDYDTIKLYIDLAYEMGWKYLILDEGWQPNSTTDNGKRYDGYFSWFDEMVDYANEKGVGLIVWVLCNDLNTPEEREILEEWAAKGIKGIKADFFDSEDPQMIQNYKAIYEKCVECKLIANIHGANKPTGERMYYPNIINREAVNGEEYGGYSTSNTVIWPYTRGVVGPMDLTPRYYPSRSTQTTVGQQMAMNVVFECGIPCMASTPNEYLTAPAYLFFKGLPAAWDETEYISGTPGTYTVLARRSGDNWYVGGITSSSKTVEFEFDFLEEGYTYTALIFGDGKGKYDIVTDSITVKKGDTYKMSLKTNGGEVIRLIRNDDENAIKSLTADKTEYTLKAGQNMELAVKIAPEKLDFTDLLWTSSNPEIVTVQRGSIKALKGGTATVTASSYTSNAKIEFKITVENEGGSALADGWSIFNPVSLEGYTPTYKNDDDLVLPTLTGDIAGSFRNVVYTAAPKGDFEVMVKINCMLNDLEQTGGIVLFSPSDRSSAIAVANRYCDPDGDNYPPSNYFQLYSVSGTSFGYNTSKSSSFPTVYLKLVVKDNTCTGYFSINSVEWTKIGSNSKMTNLLKAEDLSIGLYASSGSGGDITNVTFFDVKVNSKSVPVLLKDGIAPTPEPTPDETVTPDTTPDVTVTPDETVKPGETVTPEATVTPEKTDVPEPQSGNPVGLIIAIVVVAAVLAGLCVYFFIIKKKK